LLWYINKIKCVFRMTQLYVYFIIIVLLATSFGLKRPSSGQYLQKKLKMLVNIVKKSQFYGIPFTFIRSLYNYYQPLDVLSVVSCVDILYCEYYGCISKICSSIDNLKILNY
jgi:hypothetical protein